MIIRKVVASAVFSELPVRSCRRIGSDRSGRGGSRRRCPIPGGTAWGRRARPRRVIEHDIQNHFQTGRVQGRDHVPEFLDLATGLTRPHRSRVRGVRAKKPIVL